MQFVYVNSITWYPSAAVEYKAIFGSTAKSGKSGKMSLKQLYNTMYICQHSLHMTLHQDVFENGSLHCSTLIFDVIQGTS